MSFTNTNWVGLTLCEDRYQVLGKLGEGGMGFVFKARDRRLDTDVVIKMPRPSMLENPQFAGRFAREIRSMVKLAHPHIVKVHDVGEHAGVPFAVMQFLPGGSLRERRVTGPDGQRLVMQPHDLAGWLGDVAGALDFIHSQGYIHRDVKPDNILFDGSGHVYLSDFGLAKVVADNRAREQQTVHTGTGALVGTPCYLSPEFLREEQYDGRSDQYALGVTVYEMLSGRPPFTGPSAVVIAQHMTQPPPPLHEAVAALPQPVSAAVHRALAKDPAQRFPSCTAFAREVVAALATAPALPAWLESGIDTFRPAQVDTRIRPATAPTARIPVAVPPQGAAPHANPGKRGKLLVAGGILAVLLAGVALGGWLALRSARSPEPAPKEIALPEKPPDKLPPRKVALPPPEPPPASLRLLPLTADVALKPGESQWLDVNLEGSGLKGTIRLQVEGLPAKLKAAPVLVMLDSQQRARARLQFSASNDAEELSQLVRVVASADHLQAERPLQVLVKKPALPTPLPPAALRLLVNAGQGSLAMLAGKTQGLEVRVERLNFKGPVQVRLINLPSSLTAETLTIPADRDTGHLAISVPATTRTANHTIRVLATAENVRAEEQVVLRLEDFGEFYRFLGHADAVHDVAFSADGRQIASASADKTVRVWDTAVGKEVWRFEYHSAAARNVNFSPVEYLLASVGEDRTVRLYDTKTGKQLRYFTGLSRGVWQAFFNATGSQLQAVADDKTVVWDVRSGKELASTRGVPLTSQTMILSRDGKHALSGRGDTTVTLWRMSGTKPVEIHRFKGHTGIIWGMEYSPSTRRVLTASADKTVRLWNATTGAQICSLEGHSDEVLSVVFSPDSAWALSGSKDKTLRLWKLPPP